MSEFRRSCTNCDEPIELALPERTVRVGYDQCDNANLKNHNLERKIECKNCNELIILYYCTEGHTEDLLPN